MKKAIIYDLICSFLLLLFLYTALSKFIDHHSFRVVLQKSPLLEQAAPAIAWLLPAGEIGIAGLLFFPTTRAAGLYASLFSLLSFTAYLSYMLAAGSQLPCSCGGVLKSLSWRQHLVFNTGCIALSCICIRLHYSLKKTDPNPPGTPGIPPLPG